MKRIDASVWWIVVSTDTSNQADQNRQRREIFPWLTSLRGHVGCECVPGPEGFGEGPGPLEAQSECCCVSRSTQTFRGGSATNCCSAAGLCAGVPRYCQSVVVERPGEIAIALCRLLPT
jgi:hypothetical protein